MSSPNQDGGQNAEIVSILSTLARASVDIVAYFSPQHVFYKNSSIKLSKRQKK